MQSESTLWNATISHKVELGLVFSLEGGTFIAIVAVIAVLIVILFGVRAHDIVDHSCVVVALVLVVLATELESSFLALLDLFLLLLLLRIEDDLQVVGNLLDLLGVAMLRQIFA